MSWTHNAGLSAKVHWRVLRSILRSHTPVCNANPGLDCPSSCAKIHLKLLAGLNAAQKEVQFHVGRPRGQQANRWLSVQIVSK